MIKGLSALCTERSASFFAFQAKLVHKGEYMGNDFRGDGGRRRRFRAVKIGREDGLVHTHGLSMRRKGLIIGRPGETGAGNFGTGSERLTGVARIYFGGGGLTVK